VIRPDMLRILVVPLAGFLATCSFEFRPPSGLAGSYELEQGCVLEVSEIDALASCDRAGKSAKVTIEEQKVVFDEIVVTETETNSECWVERVCTKTYMGSASRDNRQGSPYDGRFSKLYGKWEGKLLMKVACSKKEATSNAPDWCKTSEEEVTYTFTAGVNDHEVEIAWTGSNGASGNFKALETQGGVRVADTFYRRIESE
jgi:hypothetical protein